MKLLVAFFGVMFLYGCVHDPTAPSAPPKKDVKCDFNVYTHDKNGIAVADSVKVICQ